MDTQENSLYNNEDIKLSEAELDGINAGLADLEAGKVHTHEEVVVRIQQKIAQLHNR